jgi:hypothetical protein
MRLHLLARALSAVRILTVTCSILKTHRYMLTASQNYGAGFMQIPRFFGINPVVITFR